MVESGRWVSSLNSLSRTIFTYWLARTKVIRCENKECGGDASGVEDIVRNMKAVERAVLGFMCKQIIDMGRLMWVKECCLETEFVIYVPTSIFPENHLLIARHTNQF
nr:hypothetical protein CFP56_28205 [Quercus suber]